MDGQSFSPVQLFMTPWTVVHQAPLSMGFSRQEYWSRLLFPSSGDLPNLGIERASPASAELAGRFFTTEPPWKPVCVCVCVCVCVYKIEYYSDIKRIIFCHLQQRGQT